MTNHESLSECSNNILKFNTSEEFGDYIKQEDQKLVESKLRKYSLIDSEGNTSSFYTPKTTESKITNYSDQSFKSPITNSMNNIQKKISIFSSGAKVLKGSEIKNKPNKRMPIPVINGGFKKRLQFSPEE